MILSTTTTSVMLFYILSSLSLVFCAELLSYLGDPLIWSIIKLFRPSLFPMSITCSWFLHVVLFMPCLAKNVHTPNVHVRVSTSILELEKILCKLETDIAHCISEVVQINYR